MRLRLTSILGAALVLGACHRVCPKGAKVVGAAPPKGQDRACLKTLRSGKRVRVGRHEMWWDNGHLKLDEHYVDGKLDGVQVVYHENGRRFTRSTFKGGVLDGPFTQWYETGQEWRTGAYAKGKRTGKWTTFHLDGTKASSGTFSGDVKDGRWEIYRTDGVPHEAMIYRRGKRSGPYVIWYQNGSKQEQGIYRDGLKDGVEDTWDRLGHPTGKIRWHHGHRVR